MIDTDHGGHVVAHRVHGVVRLVAMKRPIAFFIGHKFDLPHLPDRHIGGDLRPARRFRRRAAIGTAHRELMTVQVNRMIGHGQIADADTNFVILSDDQRVDAGKDAAVP